MLQRYLCGLLLCLNTAVAAFAGTDDREVYAVGVYEGLTRSGGEVHGPRAKVVVDRPGRVVTLLLGSYEPVRWVLETMDGTGIDTVILHGYGAERSEIMLNGLPVIGAEQIEDLPDVHEPQGISFRRLVTAVPEVTGAERLDGFFGDYSAPEGGFRIDAPQKDAALTADSLADIVRPMAMSAAMRDALAARLKWRAETAGDLHAMLREGYPGSDGRGGTVTFDDEGFVHGSADGAERRVPVTLDVPAIDWPVSGVYDPARQTYWGITSHVQSLLYQYKVKTDSWSVVAEFDAMQVGGLVFDSATNRLILAAGELRTEGQRSGDFVFGQRGPGLIVYGFQAGYREILLAEDALPGFTDLYDPGNGPAPQLTPLMLDDDRVLVLAEEDMGQLMSDDDNRDALPTPRTRAWVVSLGDGTSQLVHYTD